MRNVIKDSVQRNVELFKGVIDQQSEKRSPQATSQMRVFNAAINRITGEISFADRNSLKAKEWKPISIKLSVAPKEEAFFEIVDQEENNQTTSNGLEPLAYRVMNETLKVLNLASQEIRNPQEVDKVLNQISRAHFDYLNVGSNKGLLTDAGYKIDREGAEKLLLDHPSGTFLFRRDEYADILETMLKNEGRAVQCHTLTFLSPNQKVSDLTIVKKEDNGWLFYDDDPKLEGPSYPTIEALLDSMDNQLKMPLLR